MYYISLLSQCALCSVRVHLGPLRSNFRDLGVTITPICYSHLMNYTQQKPNSPFQDPTTPWVQSTLSECTWQGRFQNFNFWVLFRAHFPTTCNWSPNYTQKLLTASFQAPSTPWVQLAQSKHTWGHLGTFQRSGAQSTLSERSWFRESKYFTQNLHIGFLFPSRTQIRCFCVIDDLFAACGDHWKT